MATVSTSPIFKPPARRVDALAVHPHMARYGEPGRQRARSHEPRVPEPAVDALALAVHSVVLLAGFEPGLERGERGERRVRIRHRSLRSRGSSRFQSSRSARGAGGPRACGAGDRRARGGDVRRPAEPRAGGRSSRRGRSSVPRAPRFRARLAFLRRAVGRLPAAVAVGGRCRDDPAADGAPRACVADAGAFRPARTPDFDHRGLARRRFGGCGDRGLIAARVVASGTAAEPVRRRLPARAPARQEPMSAARYRSGPSGRASTAVAGVRRRRRRRASGAGAGRRSMR